MALSDILFTTEGQLAINTGQRNLADQESLAQLQALYESTQGRNLPEPAPLSGRQKALGVLLAAIQGAAGGDAGVARAAAIAMSNAEARQRETARIQEINARSADYADLRRQNIALKMADVRDDIAKRKSDFDLSLIQLQENRRKAASDREADIALADRQHKYDQDLIRLRADLEKSGEEASPFWNAREGEPTPIGDQILGDMSLLRSGKVANKDGTIRAATPDELQNAMDTVETLLDYTGARGRSDHYSQNLVAQFDAIKAADIQTAEQVVEEQKDESGPSEQQLRNRRFAKGLVSTLTGGKLFSDSLPGNGRQEPLPAGAPGAAAEGFGAPSTEAQALGIGDVSEDDLNTTLDLFFSDDIASRPAFDTVPGLTEQGSDSLFYMLRARQKARQEAIRSILDQ